MSGRGIEYREISASDYTASDYTASDYATAATAEGVPAEIIGLVIYLFEPVLNSSSCSEPSSTGATPTSPTGFSARSAGTARLLGLRPRAAAAAWK